MKPKTLVLMLVAIGCGLVAAILVKQLASAKPVTTGEEYLIAKVDMKRGDKITSLDNQFRVQQFAPGTSPPGAISKAAYDAKPGEVLGKVLVQPILKDETITEKHLKDDNLTEKCPPGYRAMAVPVRVDTAVAGFVLPGVRVDLICAYSKDNKMVTRTFLQNILVLAADTKTSRENTPGPNGEPSAITPPATLTLALKPKMAQVVALAQVAGGKITMTLRRPDDTKVDEEMTVTDDLSVESGDDDPKKSKNDQILIAKQDIKRGTELPIDNKALADMFEIKPYPPSPLNATFLKSMEGVKGGDRKKVVQVDIKAKDPVTYNALGETAPVIAETSENPEFHVLKIFNGAGAPPIVLSYQKLKNGWEGSATGRPSGESPSPSPTPSPSTPTPMPTPGGSTSSEGK